MLLCSLGSFVLCKLVWNGMQDGERGVLQAGMGRGRHACQAVYLWLLRCA